MSVMRKLKKKMVEQQAFNKKRNHGKAAMITMESKTGDQENKKSKGNAEKI